MQGTRGRLYYGGSLEAAARFGVGGRPAEPAIAAQSDAAGPLESPEPLAVPPSNASVGAPTTQDLMLWGRCGFVPTVSTRPGPAR
jgi:hypothetical protein